MEMEIYEFEKSLLDRLEEAMSVLSWRDTFITPSQVRSEWTYYIELQIEPTGWQAMWKIPRSICTEMNLRYPVVVFGMVEEICFEDLQVKFRVEAVQDEDIHIPEYHFVGLEDLYPTINQENTELNIDRTADVVDRYRFFMKNVWMPWDGDSDDDIDWVETHLKSRILFCYDLRKRTMNRQLTAHIRALLSEAKCIQEIKESLENDLSDEDESIDTGNVKKLMRLHLRMSTIRSEIDLLENPKMREVYSELHFKQEKDLLKLKEASASNLVYVVSKPSSIEEQEKLLTKAKQNIENECIVQICSSLQEILSTYGTLTNIFLPPGIHTIKFLEYLNGGRIYGTDSTNNNNLISKNDVIIDSIDAESVLLVFDGDFILENIVIDCKKVRLGLLIKNGKVRLKNCRFFGDGKSSTQQGILCSGDSKVFVENCFFSNFGTGILVNQHSGLTLINTKIVNCNTGLDISTQTGKLLFNNVTISGAQMHGIYVASMPITGYHERILKLENLKDLSTYNDSVPWSGDCTFDKCRTNIYIMNQSAVLYSPRAYKVMYDEDESLPDNDENKE